MTIASLSSDRYFPYEKYKRMENSQIFRQEVVPNFRHMKPREMSPRSPLPHYMQIGNNSRVGVSEINEKQLNDNQYAVHDYQKKNYSSFYLPGKQIKKKRKWKVKLN